MSSRTQTMPRYSSMWLPNLADAALREGWVLSPCSGDTKHALQVQRVDDPASTGRDFDIPLLRDDSQAWAIVKAGTGPHHEIAKELLGIYGPAELQALLQYRLGPKS